MFIYWAALLHYRPELALLKVEDIKRSKVLAGALQGTNHFPSIISGGSYVQVPLEVWVVFKAKLALKVRGLAEGTSIHRDW